MENERKEDGECTGEIFKIIGDWNKQSNALKINCPELSNEDVNYEAGKETDLFKRLENRFGKNRSEVIGILKTNHKSVY